MEAGGRWRGHPRRGGRGQRGGRGRGTRNGDHYGRDDDGRPDQGRREPYVTRPIGYKRLEEMAETETPRDIIVKLAGSRSGLEERLRGDWGESRHGMIYMLLKVFGKMTEYDEQTNHPLIHVLDLILKYDFLGKVVTFLYDDFTSASFSGRRGPDVNHVINTLKLMNMLLTCVPKTSEKKVSMHLLILTNVVDGMGQTGELARELLLEVQESLNHLKERQKVKQERKIEKGLPDDLHSQTPPGDFREIPVFPQLHEIQGTAKPFLRPNLIERGYQNADHYLDVQYRLLREDFIRPLREGIQDIMYYGDSDRHGIHFQNVKVYQDVKIAFMKPDPKGILHTIQFSTEKLQRVRWKNTKRLLYGNLLCLSSDQFKNDVLFAVVADRRPEHLEQGYLTVQFVHEEEDDEEEGEDEEDMLLLDEDLLGAGFLGHRRQNRRKNVINMDRVYTMVETEAYFEAYRHVLSGLRETKEIPLERYIVSCEPNMQAPEYLRPRVAGRVSYDFSCVMENGRMVEVLHYDWPSARELNLDKSQYEALKLALTNELAIIQGPPGTGKTYVGLEIMKILLKNNARWAPDLGGHKQSCPILVVCYTNHALDQFLEGIAKFTTENQTIVRVGGRCKNEVTKKYSLNELRRKRRANKVRGDENAATRRTIWELRSDMRILENELQSNCNQLEASLRIIQKFEVLEGFIPNNTKDQFYAGTSLYDGGWIGGQRASVNEVFLTWLGLMGSQEEPDFAPLAQNLSDLNQAILLSMGYTREDMGRAFHAKGVDDIMTLHTWLQRWYQAQAARGTQAQVNDPQVQDVEEEDDGNMEEADLVQEGRIMDTDEADLTTSARNTKENERHVEHLMKQMALVTFEDIGGRIGSEVEEGWQQTGHDKKKAKQRIKKELGKTTTMTYAEEQRVRDIHALKIDQRWKLYRTWVSRWRGKFRYMSDEKVEKYNNLARRLQDLRKQEDADIIRGADVVAITTTGAAKYRDLIYKMNCKIVVVEEAAEVLEAHIITAMPLSTKHLILIGDHQQLKPSPTVYRLAKDFHLDTSLFERLMGKVPHVTLTLQHRMKPEIADLLRPRIYKELNDHESVLGRPEITGMAKSMFFLTHDVKEESVADGRSKKNQHEADFLIQLCKYLIMQGYETHQITILAMYTGQLFAFRNKMREELCRGVRVTAVDNFQGEENDIILLSLVRSNEEARIGFLGVDNRICVALSRAKYALYCIGNLELLASKSPMWRKICGHLLEKDAIGEELALQCKHHADKLTLVKQAGDFSKVPEGGCGQPCGVRLACGHVCPRTCHPEDHSKAMCGKRCEKELPCGHKCKRKCPQQCGSCTENVKKILPCGHEQQILCYQDSNQIKCLTKVAVKLSCGHKVNLPCHQASSPSRSMCTEKCGVFLDCDHPCKGSCSECFQGRLHVPCRNKCNRTLVCGHACTSTCSACPPCEQECNTRCKHSKCGKKCGEPCVMCRERCGWKCPHYRCSKLCSEPCDRPPCNIPCSETIPKCGHQCIGLCGEPCPKLCRTCDKDKVTEIFFGNEDEKDARFVQLEDCGHVFTYDGLDQWMEQEESGNAIKMKACPRCSRLIWRSTRYGKIINNLLKQVNKVKTKIWGDATLVGRNAQQLQTEIHDAVSKFQDTYPMDIGRIRKELEGFSRESRKEAPGKLVMVERKFRRLEKLSLIKKAWKKLLKSSDTSSSLLQLVERDLDCIRQWVVLPRNPVTDPQSSQDEKFSRETERIKQALKFIDTERKWKNLEEFRRDSAGVYMKSLKTLLIRNTDPYDETKKKMVELQFKLLFEKFPELSSNLGISNEEKRMICKAMDFAQKGHWYKCPKGHIYAIGECGGATMTAKCPECNATIGGEDHRLQGDNRVASEMDGATRPAYDPHMNYVPQNLLDILRRQGFQ